MPVRLTRTTPIDIGHAVAAGGKRAIAATHTSSTQTSTLSSDHNEEDYYVMTPDVAEMLVSRTEQKVQDFLDKAPWVRAHSRLEQIQRLDAEEVQLGRVIAEGGFSNITEVVRFPNNKSLDTDDNKRYVVKHLKPQLAMNPTKLKSAARDICNEIHVLSALDHQHIVQVQGLSSAGLLGFAETGRVDSFFLVQERLEHSLLHRICLWRQRGIQSQSLSLSALGKCQSTLSLFQDRIRAARQLASALVYLHQNRLLHRDIKPGNVAFDRDGCLKLIDFGLAVELPSSEDPTATFYLGNAGTVRYQAPEVIQKRPYNAKSETFSVAIVLWEIISLTKPYEHLSSEEVKESVCQIGSRPTIPRSWPKALRSLLKKGWSHRMYRRPSMAEMEATLERIGSADYSKRSSSFALFGF